MLRDEETHELKAATMQYESMGGHHQQQQQQHHGLHSGRSSAGAIGPDAAYGSGGGGGSSSSGRLNTGSIGHRPFRDPEFARDPRHRHHHQHPNQQQQQQHGGGDRGVHVNPYRGAAMLMQHELVVHETPRAGSGERFGGGGNNSGVHVNPYRESALQMLQQQQRGMQHGMGGLVSHGHHRGGGGGGGGGGSNGQGRVQHIGSSFGTIPMPPHPSDRMQVPRKELEML